MTLDVNALEAIWILLNGATLVITVVAVVDAYADRAAVRALNGAARELAVEANVRRERARFLVQALMLLAVVPGAMAPGAPVVSLSVVALMFVPVVLLVSTLMDARDRRRLTRLIAAELSAER